MHHHCCCTKRLLRFLLSLLMPFLRWSFDWRWNWRWSIALCIPSKVWLSILIDCKLLLSSCPIWFGTSSIDLSSSTLERRMIGHAQGALVPGVLSQVLAEVLARESRRTIHIIVWIIDSFILRLFLSILRTGGQTSTLIETEELNRWISGWILGGLVERFELPLYQLFRLLVSHVHLSFFL